MEYAAVIVELRHRTPTVDMSKQDLIECCKGMQIMARDVVFSRETTVEIDRRPDLILEDIKSAVDEYPEDENIAILI